MNRDTATELADKLEEDPSMWGGLSKVAWPAAGELRRLDAENADLRQRVAGLEALRVPDGVALVGRGALQMVINALRRDAEGGKQVRGEMADMLAAAPQPLAQPEQRVPDGWKLVPVNPDGNMKIAGGFACTRGQDIAHHTYTAMLAAAPQPLAQPEQAVQGEPFAYYQPNCPDNIMGAAQRERYANRVHDSSGMVAFTKACTEPLYTNPHSVAPREQLGQYCHDALVSKLANVRSIAAWRLPSVEQEKFNELLDEIEEFIAEYG